MPLCKASPKASRKAFSVHPISGAKPCGKALRVPRAEVCGCVSNMKNTSLALSESALNLASFQILGEIFLYLAILALYLRKYPLGPAHAALRLGALGKQVMQALPLTVQLGFSQDAFLGRGKLTATCVLLHTYLVMYVSRHAPGPGSPAGLFFFLSVPAPPCPETARSMRTFFRRCTPQAAGRPGRAQSALPARWLGPIRHPRHVLRPTLPAPAETTGGTSSRGAKGGRGMCLSITPAPLPLSSPARKARLWQCAACAGAVASPAHTEP